MRLGEQGGVDNDMRSELRDALKKLEQEARAAGRTDLVHHLDGVRSILESICQAIDTEARRALPTDRHSQDEGAPSPD
jgi:hypothetical protein